ncbi:Uncharacterised protein [Mycobacteroides abscessus subsp. abscessus]|nr:Uncharacterised protein [Mycobacteroides abscessus subsp. abscessus]
MGTRRGRNQLEQDSGTIPRRLKTKPMRAVSTARRKSAASVMVMPTPTAGPFTAAMIGLRDSNIRSTTSPPASR